MEIFNGDAYMGISYNNPVEEAVSNLGVFATMDEDYDNDEAIQRIEAGQAACFEEMESEDWPAHALLVSSWEEIARLAVNQLS